MIYTEVLPFIWLGFVLFISILLIGIGSHEELTTKYLPLPIVWIAASVYSKWWFWPPFLYLSAKISHALAKGRNCSELQAHTDLTGKVAIVTGSNSGIGYYTALQLAEMGATVILACRTEEKAIQTARQIINEILNKRGGKRVGGRITNVEPTEASLTPIIESQAAPPSGTRPATPQQIGSKVPLKIVSQYGKEINLRTDLSIEMDDFVSVRRFASRFLATGLPLHFLVNNAGMMLTDLQFSKFNPELEIHTAVNFLGPHLLTELLWEKLCQTTKELGVQGVSPRFTKSRVVFVTSEAHRFPTFDSALKWSQRSSVDEGEGKIVSALASANKGGIKTAYGFIIKPSVNVRMAGFVRYGMSKLCNLYSAHYFTNKKPFQTEEIDSPVDAPNTAAPSPISKGAVPNTFASTNVKVPLVVALHPGLIASNFANNLVSFFQRLTFITLAFQKTAFEGSQTTVYACICPENEVLPLNASQNPYLKVANQNEVKNPKQWNLVSRYLCECGDYTCTEMAAIGWSLLDAQEVTEWAMQVLNLN